MVFRGKYRKKQVQKQKKRKTTTTLSDFCKLLVKNLVVNSNFLVYSTFKDLIPYEPIELMWPARAQGPEWYLGCPQVGQFSSKVIKERVNFWFSMKIAQWV